MPGSFRLRRLVKRRHAATGGSTGGGDMDAYFDMVSALPTHFDSWSLRDSTSITESGASPLGSTELWYSDTTVGGLRLRWRKERVVSPVAAPGGASSNENLIFLDVQQSSGEFLVIWHARYDSIWRPVAHGGGLHPEITGYTHKEFNFMFDPDVGNGSITWETRNKFTGSTGLYGGLNSTTDCAVTDCRLYTADDGSTDALLNSPPGLIGRTGYRPTGRDAEPYESHPIRFNEWTRYVSHVKLNVDETNFPEWESDQGVTIPAGTYHSFSQWVQTPRGVTRVYYKVPSMRTLPPPASTNVRDTFNRIWIENNTSSHQIQPTGSITVTGTPGSAVPSTQRFTRVSDGAGYQNTGGSTTIGGGGVATIAVQGIIGEELGETANASSGVAMTVVNPQSGVDSTASVGSSGITGGAFFINDDGFMWFRDFIVLKNYTSAEFSSTTPENDTVIFEAM